MRPLARPAPALTLLVALALAACIVLVGFRQETGLATLVAAVGGLVFGLYAVWLAASSPQLTGQGTGRATARWGLILIGVIGLVCVAGAVRAVLFVLGGGA